MIVVVVDTGVYVSALVFGGIPQVAVTKAMRAPYRIAVSDQIENELAATLVGKFGWDSNHVADAGKNLWSDALWRQPAAVTASRDPDDDHVLGCAVAAGARFLVTGDKDLLVLDPFGSVAIMTPAQFLATASPGQTEDDHGEQ